MSRTPAAMALCFVFVLFSSCAGKVGKKGADGGVELIEDAGVEEIDGGVLTPPDAGIDAGMDAGVDAGIEEDAGVEEIDAGVEEVDAGMEPDAGVDLDAGVVELDAGYQPLGPRCFGAVYRPGARGPNYDQYEPQVGTHCRGTNYQQIDGIERVVFVGDSITVGSPGETTAAQFYRVKLAEMLKNKFNLSTGGVIDWTAWQTPDSIAGTTLVREAGDFASCAKWGARVDDLMQDNHQIEDCIPLEKRNKRTLVVMTIGGNDIDSLAKYGLTHTYEESRAQVEGFVQLMRNTMHWFKDDPTRFPNGVFVVFANMYEFTDGTGDTASCPAAGLAGIQPWSNPDDLANLVIYANEQFLEIAVETRTDMIFLLEEFCGHGYHNMDSSSPCYRPSDNARFFDLTCIHPNPAGHQRIADMFMSLVNE